MRLCISKTIEERAEVKAERLSFDNKDELWRADVISLNRKKVIVFINEQSSLTFFYFRPSERDFRHLSDVFKSVLSENFKALGIDYPAPCDITVSKGESKALFAKARERLLLFEEYLADDDSFLIYPAFMINSRKVRGESPVESYLASHGLKRKDYSFMLKIRRDLWMYDLVIIGSGPAGLAAANRLNQFGAFLNQLPLLRFFSVMFKYYFAACIIFLIIFCFVHFITSDFLYPSKYQ